MRPEAQVGAGEGRYGHGTGRPKPHGTDGPDGPTTSLLPGTGTGGCATHSEKGRSALEQNPPHKRGRGARPPKARHASKEATDIQALTSLMGRLILLHEDALNAMALKTEVMIFTQAGPGGLVDTMVRVSEAWHAKVKDGSQTSGLIVEKSPLRMMMAASLFTELTSKSAKVEPSFGRNSSNSSS